MQSFMAIDHHLLEDDKPSIYFNELAKTGIFESKYPYTLLGDLKKIPQSPVHHPEGSVWNHTMLVLDNAGARKDLSKSTRVLMWAALLHDLGKALSTKVRKGKITSYNHDKVGEMLAVKFLRELTDNLEFINQVSKMVRWHMQILFVIKELPFADIGKMIDEADVEEVALLGLCDRLGRGEMTIAKTLVEEKGIVTFLEKCNIFSQNGKSLL